MSCRNSGPHVSSVLYNLSCVCIALQLFLTHRLANMQTTGQHNNLNSIKIGGFPVVFLYRKPTFCFCFCTSLSCKTAKHGSDTNIEYEQHWGYRNTAFVMDHMGRGHKYL